MCPSVKAREVCHGCELGALWLCVCVCHCSELLVWLTARLVLPCVKLIAAYSSVKVREVCHGCELGAIWGCRLATKRTRKNSSREGEGISAFCLAIGRCIAKSLGGGIDWRKEIDLWLLQMKWLITSLNAVNWGEKSSRLDKIGCEGDLQVTGIMQEIKIWPYYQMVHVQTRICPRKWDSQNSLGF